MIKIFKALKRRYTIYRGSHTNYTERHTGNFFTLASSILALPVHYNTEVVVVKYLDTAWGGSQITNMAKYYPENLTPHEASKIFIHILLSTTKNGVFEEFTYDEYTELCRSVKSSMDNKIKNVVNSIANHSSLTHPSSVEETREANRASALDIISNTSIGLTERWMFDTGYTIYDEVSDKLNELIATHPNDYGAELDEYMQLVRDNAVCVSQLYNMWVRLEEGAGSLETLSTFSTILKVTRVVGTPAVIPYKVYREMFNTLRSAIIGSEYLILGSVAKSMIGPDMDVTAPKFVMTPGGY